LDSRQRAQQAQAEAAESKRRFDLQNTRADAQLGIQQAQEARSASSAPLQQDLLRAQIEEARRNGATEAQLAPLKLQMVKAQTGLYEAQASAARQKDELNTTISSMIRGAIPHSPAANGPPPVDPPENPIRQQSMTGNAPTPSLYVPPDASPPSPLLELTRSPDGQTPGTGRGGTLNPMPRDPNVILAQNGQGPQPSPQPSTDMVRTPLGLMPIEQAQRLGFALGLAGKGDAGRIFVDAANQNRLGKKATGEVEDQLINRISDLSDLQNIRSKIQQNPKMLEVSSKLKATGLSWQAWIDSGSVSPEDRKFLGDYQRFRTATVDRLNNRIKAFAGAAVSGQEKERMYAANPNENDDPITFAAKLDEQMSIQRYAIARYNWLKTQGLQPGQIRELAQSGRIEGFAGLEDMKGIYDKRADQLEQELRQRQPNLQPQQYRELRNRQLKQEFGI
ncbi:MAG: hypothetical protein AB7U78_23920, partial [Hyphomicrobiaceae bacterium]